MGTSKFIINEATCYHAPPSKVLDVGVVGDVVYLAICDNDETDSRTTVTVIKEEIAVDANTLYDAIEALSKHATRAANRRDLVEEPNCCRDDKIVKDEVE